MKKNISYLEKLPAYAGIKDVLKEGMSVELCAGYLARFAAIKKQCVRILAAKVTGTPEWELKIALARWMWEDATHYRDLEKRLTELRSNSTAIDKVLDYKLGDFLAEILHSPDSLELCVGLYDVLKPAFCDAIRSYISRTQPLADSSSIRLLKAILVEEEERLQIGREFVQTLSLIEHGQEIREDWINHYQRFLEVAGGILGDEKTSRPSLHLKPRAREEYRISRGFKRDQRFQTIIPKISPKQFEGDELHQIMWVRQQEITAAEMVASVIVEWEDLPTEAIVDLTRHCWDEVRHSLLGCAALQKDGFEPTALPSWIGYAHHTMNVPAPKRYSHLAIATESKAMAHPGGARGEWEFVRDTAKHPLMTTFLDFDWADEVTHVNFGRKWLVNYYFKGDREAARIMADETVAERKAYYTKIGSKDSTFDS